MGTAQTINRLRLAKYVQPPQVLHVARVPYRTGEAFGAHTHDFAEVFWIERGCGVHHINGVRRPLEAGDVWVVRPADAHAFAARGSGFVLVNIAFAADLLDHLRDRYFGGEADWPWAGDALPTHFSLDDARVALLSQWADTLAIRRTSRLELERFMLNLLAMMGPAGVEPTDRWSLMAAPAWLAQAVCEMQDGTGLAGGVAELARRAGRSPAHINRVTQQYLGKTATQLVSDLRLDYAGRQLRMTQHPILDIALRCGWSNLTHFYRLFKARYGATPRRFRLREQALAGRSG